VHLMRADDPAGRQAQYTKCAPVVLFDRDQIVTDGVAQVERGIGWLAHTADAGQHGVGKPFNPAQPLEAIQ